LHLSLVPFPYLRRCSSLARRGTMSRALTVYSRREASTKHEPGELERVMEAQGCSEPVAKNLIKYAKLGIGPLCDPTKSRYDDREAPSSGSSREQFPPRLDRKAAALLAEQKLRERQEAEEEAEERQRQPKRRIGMAQLGAVMRREEEVDPFRAPAPRSAMRKEEEEKSDDETDQMQNLFNARPQNKGPLAKKMMQIGGISLQKPRRQEEVAPIEHASGSKAPPDAEEEYEEDENQWGEEGRSRQFVEPESNKKKTQNQLQDERRGGPGKRKKQTGKKNERDASSEEEERSASPEPAAGTKSENKGGSLMTEAQIMALMGKNKKKDGYSRGSVRAKTRIQKESQEWESRKASNPEFWKAPQFALCYSAETGKRARGAG